MCVALGVALRNPLYWAINFKQTVEGNAPHAIVIVASAVLVRILICEVSKSRLIDVGLPCLPVVYCFSKTVRSVSLARIRCRVSSPRLLCSGILRDW